MSVRSSLPRRIRAVFALLVLVVVAALPGVAPPAAAQGAVVLQATAAFEGNYAPDRWLPLSIVLRNSGPATRVAVAAALPLAGARNTAVVDLPGGGEAALTLYVAMDRAARELRVTVERDGAVLAEQPIAVRPRPGERILGLVAPQPLTLSLPRREELQALPFLPFAIAPAQLPDQPAGLASLAVIVLDGVPAETVGPAQFAALHSWVRAGGHLVIGGSPDAASTVAALPAELRVAMPGGPTPLGPAPLAEYTGGQPPLSLDGLLLDPVPDALVFGAEAAPLWASRSVGAGRVTQLAFAPGQPALNAWEGAPALWDRLLRPPRVYTNFGGDFNADAIQAQTISGALANLPPINLPDTTPLFALLALYAVLIGPGLALLLRRLDRQALGWFVLPAVALGVAAIASGIAIASRADQRIASQVTLLEQVDATTARARAGLAILSPRAEQYAVAVGGSAVVRPLASGSASFGAIGGAAGDLAQDGAELAISVAPWELQGVQAEALVASPALDATLSIDERGIVATVRNTTGRTLRDVLMTYAGRAVALGDLAPDESRSATWPPPSPPGQPRPEASAPLSVIVLGEQLRPPSAAGSATERRVLLQEALVNAVAVAVPEGQSPEPLVLAWLRDSPLPLGFAATGLAAQQTGLLVDRPRIVGDGPAIVPAGWMQLVQGEAPQAFCSGDPGRGLRPSGEPLTITLALPAAMAAFRARTATLDLQSERTWPSAGVTTELYNWNTGAWQVLPFDGPGTLALPNAASYVRGGRMSVRLDGQIADMGCVFVDVALQGELPAQAGQP